MSYTQRYDEWKGIYNWETCKANRKRHGEFLMSILTSENDGHVLNLNGEWGTGKTEFLKRLYVSLSEDNHPVIYIDAWESDFTNDPLNVICSEFLNQLSYIFNSHSDSKFQSVKKKINHLLCGYLSVQRAATISSAAYKAFSNEPVYSDEIDLVKTFLDVNKEPQKLLRADVKENNNRLLENMLGSQTALVSGMKDIRNQITAISEILKHVYELNTPIIVLIDELDRCRPDYAIKTLEVIKHFFDVEGCNFLIATDTKSLQESIKAVYGSNFDSERYLRRFFNQSVVLQRPSIREYLLSKNIDFKKIAGNIELIPFSSEDEDDLLIDFLSELMDSPDLSLRDIERFLKQIVACLSYVSKQKVKNAKKINFVVLAYGVVTHATYPERFHQITNKDAFQVIGLNTKPRLEPFVSHNVSCVSSMVSTHSYNVHSGERNDFPNGMKLLRVEAINIVAAQKLGGKYMTLNIRNEYGRAVEEYRKNKGSWLMWKDYKNLIGLSDAIE
ncbi:KAP family P-loop NTPase fold protein [Vibrio alginolyticus]